VIKTKK